MAAEAFGVGLASAKLKVFVLSAMLAGLAGWLYAHFQRSVAPGPFGINAGIEYLLMAVVGGAGSIYGRDPRLDRRDLPEGSACRTYCR